LENHTPRRRPAGPGRVKLALDLNVGGSTHLGWREDTREAMARLARALYDVVPGGWTICGFRGDYVYLVTPLRDEMRVTQAWLAAALGDGSLALRLAEEYEARRQLWLEKHPLKKDRRPVLQTWLRGEALTWESGPAD